MATVSPLTATPRFDFKQLYTIAAKLASRFRKTRPDREDLIQVMLLAVVRRMDRFDDSRSSIEGFAYTVMRAAALDQVRRTKRRLRGERRLQEAAPLLPSHYRDAHGYVELRLVHASLVEAVDERGSKALSLKIEGATGDELEQETGAGGNRCAQRLLRELRLRLIPEEPASKRLEIPDLVA